MNVLECGHVALIGSSRLCEHMLVEHPPGQVALLRGNGLAHDLSCAECADGPVLLTACEGCVDRATETGQIVGVRGQPEPRRDPVAGRLDTVAWPIVPLSDRCLAPTPQGWLALTADGLVDLASGVVHAVPLPGEDRINDAFPAPAPALHVSADGRYAAVVTDYGSHGVVVDLRDGTVVLELNRGDYHQYTVPFPVAFLSGVLVAATAWNRLDAFSLPGGELLTDRETEFDYFHGRLTTSPCGRKLVDDGWVWHPFGAPLVIDVERWLRDGGDPPHDWLTTRDYAWGQPITWLTPHVVAVQRIGGDDETMIDGVTLYTYTGRRIGVFTGPAGPMWVHGGLLYVSGADGLEVWDPGSGARIGLVQDVRPTVHRNGMFASLNAGVLNIFSVDQK